MWQRNRWTGRPHAATSRRSRPAASRHTQDHRRDPGAAGHREDPHLPGAGPAAAAQGPGARGGARLRNLSRAGPAADTTHIITGCAANPQVALRDLAARCRNTKGQPRGRGQKLSLPLFARPMQTVNHLLDKLNARSPASNLGTSGGRSTVLRARRSIAEGGQHYYAQRSGSSRGRLKLLAQPSAATKMTGRSILAC